MAHGESLCLTVGFDENFVSDVDEDFQCSICRLVLREPLLTRCGHRFCRKCLEQCFTRQLNGQNQPYPCPVDREDLVHERDLFPDKATERKIFSLEIYCSSEGCNWSGELRNKESHLESCMFKSVCCTNEKCEMRIAKKDLEEHVTMKCQWRAVKCDYCHEFHSECQMEQHGKECKLLLVKCNECGANMQQEKLSDHIVKDCPHAVIPCPFHHMGCDVKIQRLELDSHLESAAWWHLDLACVKMNKNEEKYNENIPKLEAKVDALEKQLQTTWSVQRELTTALSTKLDKEILKLKEEPQPYVWKITEFNEMLRLAKRGKHTKLESGFFFTGSVGYKLSATLYPNGDQKGKNTHLSVYFQIWKGKYDALLPWPFGHKVIFTLIDQQDNADHAENILREAVPDPGQREVVSRPRKECNTGWGFSEFISHQELWKRHYIRDDTLFLKVQCSLVLRERGN